MLGRVLRIFLALVLVAILAFLYVMSEGGDLRRQTQIAAGFRTLREIDASWNRSVAAASADPLALEPRPRLRIERLVPVLDNLAAEAVPVANPTLKAGLEVLRKALLTKQKLVVQFDDANTQLRTALKDLLAQLATLRQSAAQLAETDVKLRPKLSAVDGQLAALNAELVRLYVQPDHGGAQTVAKTADALAESAGALPEALRTPLSALPGPVRRLLEQETSVADLAQQILLQPTSPRVNSLSDAFDREFQTIADEKEQFRIYLVFYSAALLVFLGYVMWQLGKSYVKLNHVNEALKSANETLEQRVQERTKELSQALTHVKESELMLIQTEKMSSLGRMVAGIAHEINTPLAYVKASLASVRERLPRLEGMAAQCRKLLGMLERGDVPDEELSAQFAQLSKLAAEVQAEAANGDLVRVTDDGLHGIEQIAEIVLNLKNFSRVDRSRLQRFNLNEGIESTLVIARNVVKHKTLRKQLREIPLVECSPSQINQVLLNLITNAAQATDDVTGEICVSTSMAPDGQVRVDVSDNGRGIPDDILPKIFDPFFTTKDIGQGTGLGLSIAYKIVLEHSGRIEVKSKVWQGTTFSVFLPVKAVQPQALAA
ncbi:MAG TPA: ATP-binding protein [Burkholderiales bacterium]|nr:ATP-binding protein [Burkholderiales bacterium]